MSISCETSFKFHTQRKSSKTPPEALPHGSELTTTRRPPDDDTTTPRRRHDKHDANTGPTPDPNYKREPFATHAGKCAFETTRNKIAVRSWSYNVHGDPRILPWAGSVRQHKGWQHKNQFKNNSHLIKN